MRNLRPGSATIHFWVALLWPTLQVSDKGQDKGDIMVDISHIGRILGVHIENLHSNKLENLQEIDLLPRTYSLPKL